MKTLHRIFALAFLVLMVVLAGCTTDTAKEKVYDVKGKVVAVDQPNKKVTLDHDEIPGHMKAMTNMPFDVENAKLLEGIKVGDQVHGKLRVKGGTSVFTELMKH
ncbi:MAG: copper-binding protein [Planctomycetes bacterium]|nr:copper-binding protein [Planctomycetota bacterium]